MKQTKWTLLIAAALQACGGVYISPAVNVPALEKARQAALTVNARVFAPHAGLSAMTSVAVSQHGRVGATATGSFPKSRRSGAYGELFGGAEPAINEVVQLGALAGVGLGKADARHKACAPADERAADEVCIEPEDIADRVTARYQRYFVQPYVVVRAPRVTSAAIGLRGGVLHMDYLEVEGQPVDQRSTQGFLEPFIVTRIGAGRVQFEQQMRYVQLLGSSRYRGERLIWPEGFVFSIGLRIRLGPVDPSAWPAVRSNR